MSRRRTVDFPGLSFRLLRFPSSERDVWKEREAGATCDLMHSEEGASLWGCSDGGGIVMGENRKEM